MAWIENDTYNIKLSLNVKCVKCDTKMLISSIEADSKPWEINGK